MIETDETEVVTPDNELSLERALEAKARMAELAAELSEEDLSGVEFTLPGDEVFGDPVDSMPVIPMGEDEFCCTSCFLIHHRAVRARAGVDVCRDCD